MLHGSFELAIITVVIRPLPAKKTAHVYKHVQCATIPHCYASSRPRTNQSANMP
jgi:hypothetical protein